jgi:UPF0176 protein
MTYKVAALYQFAALPDFEALRAPLLELCETQGIRGTLLLSPEGINGTLAGTDEGIDAVIASLTTGELFGGRLDNLELKFSGASAMPFKRLKIRLKKEIVTLAQPQVDPTRQVGTYVAAEDWNALISDPDVVVVDTRNRFEVKMGTFERALDPETRKFSQFPDFGELLPAFAGFRRGVPPQRRHPQISRDHPAGAKPLAGRMLRLR